MSDLTISRENVIKNYKASDDNTKKTLEAIFGKDLFVPKDVTERIKTFDDAIKELGESHTLVRTYNSALGIIQSGSEDMFAYLKLRIICAALNEGWEPEFTEDEWRYYPWFFLYTQAELDDMEDSEKKERRMIDTGDYQTEFAGFGSVYAGFGSAYSDDAPSSTYANFGSRLCLRASDLAVYCGKQFIKLWADYTLVRK